ncbi:hypothetical protein C5S36_03885 [Candidatus Methanophagaceae archaeon]|nr:hypothetical protein C5S36_03885 [Methanophagales archaeon]
MLCPFNNGGIIPINDNVKITQITFPTLCREFINRKNNPKRMSNKAIADIHRNWAGIHPFQIRKGVRKSIRNAKRINLLSLFIMNATMRDIYISI